MRKSTFCFFLTWLICTSLHGQDQQALLARADDLIMKSRFDEALEILHQGAGESPSIPVNNKKAEIRIRLGNFAAARKLLDTIETELVLNPQPGLQAITEVNRGFLQLNLGRSDLAETSLQNALDHFETAGITNSQDVAQALSYLGILYLGQGKYSQAQEQLHRALAMREMMTVNRDAMIAATCNDLGLAYSQTDKDVALDFYERAQKMYRKLYGDQDAKIAISSINIGIIYRDLGLYGDAINNFENALKIWSSVYTTPHGAKAIALYNLGQTYLQLKDQKAAKAYYQLSLKMYEDVYGPAHPEIVSVLNAIGNLHLAESNFDASLEYYQKALKANVQDFADDDIRKNPSLKHYYNGTALLHTLLFKAEAYEARYSRKSLKFSDLREALTILLKCDSLIDQLRRHSSHENDKLSLGVTANEVYANGVRIAYLAGLNAVRKEAYFEIAFYFAEKSKSAVLLESIADANAKSFAGIPQHTLEEEKEIKSALMLNAQKLAQKPSPEEEKRLRENAFNLQRQYESFIQTLERDYPEYFNLKFNADIPSVKDIQALLNDQTAVISYFIDDRNNQLYIFVVRKGHYKLLERPITQDFDKYITGLRNGLYFKEITTYRASAMILGRTLIPSLPSSVRDLVIIPAGRLGLVPFETLLSDRAEHVTAYEGMPYLINDFALRYEFSAGLLLQKKQRREVTANSSVFLCAPVTFPQKPHLGELPGTELEIKGIGELFSQKNLESKTVTRLQAGEQLIKATRLKDFSFLHFATHGVVDEFNPELSRIFLQSSPQEDGNLYAGEIYNLELDAGLVTLSACQTGLGKIVKGEGVIGLSRALVYAGARNILVSFWNVADESTAVLMKDFYKQLLEHPADEYAASLREAKLRLMKNEKFAAPFYWAPFILIGF